MHHPGTDAISETLSIATIYLDAEMNRWTDFTGYKKIQLRVVYSLSLRQIYRNIQITRHKMKPKWRVEIVSTSTKYVHSFPTNEIQMD